MPNKSKYRQSSEEYRKRNPNIFDGGGWLEFTSSLAPGITSIINSANTDTSNIDDAVNADIKTLRNSWSGIDNSSLDSLMNQQASLRNLDTDYNASDKFNVPTSGSIWRDSLTNAVSSAASTLGLGPWAAAGSFLFNLGSGLFGGFNKQKKIQRAVDNADAKYAAAVNKENAYRQNSIRNAMENKVANNDRMLFSQVAAYGGPLGISLLPVDSAIDFMQNEELLSSLGEDKTKNNNRRTSMPMFAFGGALGGYGGDWSDGLNFIKAGGKHGENPLGGVPMGVAQDGQPNLVEEGEVIWNDYVFSNRIKMPKKLVEKYKLKGDPTFAVGVEQIQKNISERPNDPIEKRGLDAALAEFMGEQEMIRQRKAEKEYQRELKESAAYAADGGPIHIAKNKKGTFTAAAKKHGMGVQEFASKVLANKEDYSPTMVKKAQFAHNAKSWSHADGGYLVGQTYDVSKEEYNRLKQLGYEIEVL